MSGYTRHDGPVIGAQHVAADPGLFAPYAHCGFPVTPELRAYVLTFYAGGCRTRVVRTWATDRAEALGRGRRLARRAGAGTSFLASAVPGVTLSAPDPAGRGAPRRWEAHDGGPTAADARADSLATETALAPRGRRTVAPSLRFAPVVLARPAPRFPGGPAWRRRGRALVVCAAAGTVFTAGAGFVFGALGVGLGMLEAAPVLGILGVLVTLASRRRIHCPGCRG